MSTTDVTVPSATPDPSASADVSVGVWALADTAAGRRRLEAVADLRVLDRLGDPVLVSLVRLAQVATGAAGAAVHIFDATHQRRVAAAGAPLCDHPAQDSMCRLVVESGNRIVCANAAEDPRFSYSSFVCSSEPVRFYASLPLKVAGGVTVGTLCAFDTVARELDEVQLAQLDEIAGLAQAHLTLMRIATDLRREASIDGLTGASTRVLFDDRVAQALAARNRHGGELLVLTVDLDDFKAINDTFGHARGDSALQLVAERLTELAGPDAVVGRLGGDEFAVLCETAPEDPESLINAIATIGQSFEPAFGVSVGTARAEPGDDVPSLMRRADGSMYADKARDRRDRGRGRGRGGAAAYRAALA